MEVVSFNVNVFLVITYVIFTKDVFDTFIARLL